MCACALAMRLKAWGEVRCEVSLLVTPYLLLARGVGFTSKYGLSPSGCSCVELLRNQRVTLCIFVHWVWNLKQLHIFGDTYPLNVNAQTQRIPGRRNLFLFRRLGIYIFNQFSYRFRFWQHWLSVPQGKSTGLSQFKACILTDWWHGRSVFCGTLILSVTSQVGWLCHWVRNENTKRICWLAFNLFCIRWQTLSSFTSCTVLHFFF